MSEPAPPMAVMERVLLEMVHVYAREMLPAGVRLREPKLMLDHASRSMIAQVTGYVLGLKGQDATDYVTVPLPKFPKWLPKRLCRRWSQKMTFRLDTKPLLVYPEATIAIPELGAPVETVGWSTRRDDPWPSDFDAS